MVDNLFKSARDIIDRLAIALRSSNRRQAKDFQASFDRLYTTTSTKLRLANGWSAVACRPNAKNRDRRWAYKLYNPDGMQDHGLINLQLQTVDSRGLIKRHHIEDVESFLIDIIESYCQEGFVPAIYGTSMPR